MDLTLFDHPLIRFSTSGTLITCYAVADWLARRKGRNGRVAPSPRWLKPLIATSVTAFYVLIGPTGGALAGGLLNLAGIALVGVACLLRWVGAFRYPGLVARSLFYLALPLAVGVPWGLLVLSLPACAASLHCYLRAERAPTS
jgi:hypothetical protein